MTSQNYLEQFYKIVRAQPRLMQIVQCLAQSQPNAYVAAGVLRHVVWAHLHEREYEILHTEIDVIFFDSTARHIEARLKAKLEQEFSNIAWDVTNQAFVHEWYRTDQGARIKPLSSVKDALSMWPETATALALRINKDGDFELIAPFGLDDLFELKLRWNANLVSYAVFEQRMRSKQFLQKWQRLTLEK